MSTSQSPSDIYARLLLPKRQGYPLWIPEPNTRLPNEYKERGVGIGDVGIITSDGAFDFLFSICHPANHPINCNGVPDNFEPLELNHFDIHETPMIWGPRSDIASVSMKKDMLALGGSLDNAMVPFTLGGWTKFECSSSEGALLVLPEGAHRKTLNNLKKFRDYASQHAINWYRFMNGPLGREAPNGSIYLVTGHDNCSAWGVASFMDVEKERGLSLTFAAASIGAATGSYYYAWRDFSPASVRAGPIPGEQASPLKTQCVFFKGYKVAVREPVLWLKGVSLRNTADLKSKDVNPRSNSGLFGEKASSFMPQPSKPRLSDAKEPKDGGGFQDGKEGHEGNIFVGHAFHETPYHPSNAINKFLLNERIDAVIAITHDDDWIQALSEDEDRMPQDSDIVSRVRRMYSIINTINGMSFLSKDRLGPQKATAIPIRGGYSGPMHTTALFNVAQKYNRLINFTIVASGPQHDITWTCKVSVDGILYGVGDGRTKQQAKDAAAARALSLLTSGET